MQSKTRAKVAALVVAGLLAFGSAPGRAEEKLVNINSATAAELATLKGVGEAKAKAIIAYRDKNGPFQSVDDLDQVSGIGEKLLASLRPQLTTGQTAAAPARAGH